MTFIKGCNGKFDKDKYQIEYDLFKEKMLAGLNVTEKLVTTTIESFLEPTDIHYELIKALTEQTKANLNLLEQAIMPMTLDLYEYTIKLLQFHAPKDQYKILTQKKGNKDLFTTIFRKLSKAFTISISLINGNQNFETLYNYFAKSTPMLIQDKLQQKHHIIDPVLLSGFVECRNRYGLFLENAYNSEKKYNELLNKLNSFEQKEFISKWTEIRKLITENHLLPSQLENNAKNLSQNSNTFFSFPPNSLDQDVLEQMIKQKVQELLFPNKLTISDNNTNQFNPIF
ncbi:MAG TPA: hypothetical protein PK657_00005 [Legionella sp.]|nr:hypothetical protein [Legionella sp.]